MTRREAISQVKTALKKVNADSRMTNKQIFSVLQKHAEWLIRQQSEIFKLSRVEDIYQVYTTEVIDVPKIDKCYGLTSKCSIKRTRYRLPQIFEDSVGFMIKSVYSLDTSKEIKKATYSDYKRRKENPWGPKTDKFYFYQDGYLYGDLPKAIKVKSAFKKKLKKEECDDCGNTEECIRPLDEKWYVPNYLEAQIIDFTIKELSLELQIPAQEKINKNENQP